MHEPWSRDANSSVVGEDEIVNYIEGTVLANGDQDKKSNRALKLNW